jgi:hypothetical protein
MLCSPSVAKTPRQTFESGQTVSGIPSAASRSMSAGSGWTREMQRHFGLEANFEVNVKFDFWQGGDQVGHGRPRIASHGPNPPFISTLPPPMRPAVRSAPHQVYLDLLM